MRKPTWSRPKSRTRGPYGYAVRGDISFLGHGEFKFNGKYLGIMTEPYGGDPLTLSNYNSPVHAVDEMKCSGSYLVNHDSKELVAELTFDSCIFKFPTLGDKGG